MEVHLILALSIVTAVGVWRAVALLEERRPKHDSYADYAHLSDLED